MIASIFGFARFFSISCRSDAFSLHVLGLFGECSLCSCMVSTHLDSSRKCNSAGARPACIEDTN